MPFYNDNIYEAFEEWYSGVKVYPNPATDKIYFDLSAFSELKNVQGMYIELYSLAGRAKSQMSLSELPVSLDCSFLPQGLHFGRIYAGHKTIPFKFQIIR